MKITVLQYAEQGARGDRAKELSPYFRYEVVLYGMSHPVVLRTWEGYDNFNNHIPPDCKEEAVEYAKRVVAALDGCEYGGVESYKKQVVQHATWVKV